MMKWFNRILTALIFLALVCCKQSQQGLFSSELANDRGSLAILNDDPYIGATAPGNSFDHEIILFSQGGLEVYDINVTLNTTGPITYAGGSYPGTGGTCGTFLGSGETCSIVIHFEPTTVSTFNAALSISYRDSLGTGSLNYAFNADSHPILQFEYGTQYDFGNRFIGTTTDLKIKITNVGRVPAENVSINNLTAPFSYKGGVYPGTGGNCGNRVPVGGTCDIVISYTPSNSAQHSQDITLTYTNNSRPEESTLSLLAWGFYEAVLSADLSTGLNFGTVAAGHDHFLTLTLTHASGDVTATNIAIAGLGTPFSRSGGTCASMLSKTTGSCTMIFKLNTASSGTWSQNITISYNNGFESKSMQRTLTGLTKQKAVLSFSFGTSLDFGTVRTTTSSNQTVTVSYSSGEFPATGLTLSSTTSPFSYAGGSFPGTGGNCTSSITSGSCTVVLAFSPTTQNNFSTTRFFSYGDGYSTNYSPNVTLSGITESLLYWFSSNTVAFGDVVVGQTRILTRRIDITRGATATQIGAVNPSAPFAFTGGAFPGTNGTCQTSHSDTWCNVELIYTPTSTVASSQTLTINYHNGIEARTLTASMSGTGKPAATLTLANADFGDVSVNSTFTKYITLTNTSTMTATSLSVSPLPTGFTTRTTGQSCSTSLAAGSSCTLGVLFSPVSATTYSGTMTVSYNDGTGTKTVTSDITGNGVTSSELHISDFDTYTFTNTYVGAARTKVFNISHGGSSTPAVISSKTLSLSSDYSIISDNCPASLANGQTCSITVEFRPIATGTRSSNLTVAYSNGSSQSVVRQMTGTGLSPGVLTLSATSHDFGTQPTDATYELTLQVTKTGTTSSNSPSITGTGFSYAGTGSFPGGGTCTTSFVSGCTVKVKFFPTQALNYTGKFEISYWNGYQTTKATANLSGTGSPTAVLSYSSSSTDFGTVIQSLNTSRTLTVSHSGTVAATSLSSASLAAPYSFKGGSYPGTGGTCGSSLTSGSCTLVVEFAPTTVGVQAASLTLSYNNGSTTRQIVNSLSGEGIAQAILSKSENGPYAFGTVAVNASATKTITLINGGGYAASNLGATFDKAVYKFKDGAFPGTGGSCATTLASGGSCTIVLEFKPTAATNYTGLMTFSYNDGLRTQTELIDLTGAGQ